MTDTTPTITECLSSQAWFAFNCRNDLVRDSRPSTDEQPRLRVVLGRSFRLYRAVFLTLEPQQGLPTWASHPKHLGASKKYECPDTPSEITDQGLGVNGSRKKAQKGSYVSTSRRANGWGVTGGELSAQGG